MSVYKRGGIYWYDFWFREIRYRESTGLSNKTAATDAEAIRRAELAEGRAGIVHRGPIPKFEDFVNNEFLHWSEKQHEAHPRTNQYYRMSSKPLIALLGKLPLDGITTAYVERFKMVRAANVSPASTNRDMAALRYMLNFAIRQGYLTRNPVKGVKFLDEGPGFMRVVSHEEQRRYLDRARPLLRDVASLILEAGMRPEEVFTIRKENVHLDRRYLFVPKGKTCFARRNIPLTDAGLKILKRRMRKAKNGWVFPHRRNPHMPMKTIQKAHEEALKDAKLKSRFRLYDLRHTFGSRSAMAGVDLATLKELMGHSNISITMRYVHPTPEHKQEALRKLERFNVEQVFAMHEKRSESPQKSPQSENAPKGKLAEVVVQ
jgi:integrase